MIDAIIFKAFDGRNEARSLRTVRMYNIFLRLEGSVAPKKVRAVLERDAVSLSIERRIPLKRRRID